MRLQEPNEFNTFSKRSKVEASINQALDSYGSFYLNMSKQNYWGTSREDKQMQLGFNTQYKGVTYGVYASKTLTDNFGQNNQVVFSVSMPIGQTRSTGTYTVTRNNDGSLDQRAGLSGRDGTLTNAKGYALVPYVTPYRKNRVALDTGELDNNIDIEEGVTNVVPRRGAVVKASFAASRSEKALLNERLKDGKQPPFGTPITNEKGASAGVVGQAGQVLLSVGEGKVYQMKWGEKAEQSCRIELDVSKAPLVDGYRVADAVCK